jgi:methylmalonyl-CoA mutase cobalamin-binding domain/chain
MLETVVKAYNEAIIDTDKEQALKVVNDALAAGSTPQEIIFDVIVPAIELMMKAVSENPDASLAQHFLTAQIGAQITEQMLERFDTPPAKLGRIVLGTAQGDLHSLGKRIVGGCLKSLMYDVIDLGASVAPERFVEEAIAHDAQVIGISAMMVHTARGENGCLAVRRMLEERRLEDKIKIVVGGAPFRFDPNLYRVVKADGWAPDGLTAGKIIADLISGVSQ